MQTNSNRNTTSGVAQNAADDNELTTVSTEILAEWVTDRGRCVWESTLAGPFQWTGYTATDRPIAARMCAGCPVRAECLELETRNVHDDDQVRDAMHPSDLTVLLDLWAVRDRADIAATLDDEEPDDERPELLIGGVAVAAILWATAKARGRSRRAAVVADIARLGVSPVSLIGRVLWTTALIVAVQWVVITKAPNQWALLAVLAVPALVAASAVVRALTVTAINPDVSRTRRQR